MPTQDSIVLPIIPSSTTQNEEQMFGFFNDLKLVNFV